MNNQAQQIAEQLAVEFKLPISVAMDGRAGMSIPPCVNIYAWRLGDPSQITYHVSAETAEQAIAKFRAKLADNRAAFSDIPVYVAPQHSGNSITFYVERHAKPNGVLIDFEETLTVYYDHSRADPSVDVEESVDVTEVLDADGRNFIDQLEDGEMESIKMACWEDVAEKAGELTRID